MTLKLKMLALTMSALALWATPCTAVEVGQAAPDIALPDSALASQLSQLRGRHVYLDFWASWCAPCQQSFAWMHKLQARHSPEKLTVLAINLDKQRPDAERFLKKHPAGFALAFDPAGESARRFALKTMPSAYLISPEGQVLMVHRGFHPQDVPALMGQIERWVEAGTPRADASGTLHTRLGRSEQP